MKKSGPCCLIFLAAFVFSCQHRSPETEETASSEVSENRANQTVIVQKSGQTVKLLQTETQPPQSRANAWQPDGERKTGQNQQASAPDTTPIPTNSYAAASTQTVNEPILTMADIYRHFEKTPQIFTLTNRRDTTIICREGTRLEIPAHAFISETTGKAISGPVKIEVKEYYQLSDMLLGNLSTRSGRENLETGGMIQVLATSESGNCRLKPDRKIGIGFPDASRKNGMQLFTGRWQENALDWQLADPHNTGEQQDSLQVPDRGARFLYNLIKPDVPAGYRGGEKALKKHLARYARYPWSALKNKTEGTVVLSLRIEKNGMISGVLVAQSLSPALDKAAVYAASKMPNWRPALAEKKRVESIQSLAVNFSTDGIVTDKTTRSQARKFERMIRKTGFAYGDYRERSNFSTSDKAYKEAFESQVTDANLPQTDLTEINRYIFSTSEIGWMNCDRFMKDNSPKIDFVVNHQSTENVNVKVVFHSARAILPGFYRNGNYAVTNVPVGEKVTIVAFKTEGPKVLLAVKETVVNRSGAGELAFEPVTMPKLQAEMEKLNALR